ncbi:aminotransferase class I/II-fold pyridoxal phosphate-dependent enzyme [Paenibacillus sp. KS-LC4]|uniref:aminotransferase class I/II-fold pyridoxal phosphate-dependent enzyme n=1 Tax=Paenibacillus sp. KS-LC4 TaxID=2979727 RepID=UPI0030CE233B
MTLGKWRSNRLDELGSSIFAEVIQWKKEARASGMNVIDLDIGSPDKPPSAAVMETISAAALNPKQYGYMGTRGSDAFRQTAAEWMAFRFGVQVDPEAELLSLMGSQDGLAHLAMAICNPGDEVLLPNPGYPIYAGSLAIAGVKPIFYPLTAENGFLPDVEAITEEQWRRATFILLNYPGNPVSTVADMALFELVLEKARKHDVLVINDAAYSEMAFDGFVPPSILAADGGMERAIEIHSLSKSYNMAGCRIGFVTGNREAVGALRELKDNIDYGIFSVVQEAGVAALKEAMSPSAPPKAGRLYEQRRDVFVQALQANGWQVEKPRATMFLWAALPDMAWAHPDGPWTSRLIARELLEQTGVAIIPGEAFGSEGEGYVRLALVMEEERLLEAAERIGRFIRGEARVQQHSAT